MTHYTREGFIERLAYIAGDENNIRLTSPSPERTQEAGPITVQGDFILTNYSEKAVALFGDTKPIKDALSDLGGRFNGRLTYRRVGLSQSERNAGARVNRHDRIIPKSNSGTVTPSPHKLTNHKNPKI